MKVIVDVTTTQDQFASRGVGRFTHELLSTLVAQSAQSKREDTFYFLTFNSPTPLDETIQQYPEIVRTINIGKIHASDKFNPIWWNVQYMPTVRSLIKSENPDTYLCPYFWRGFPARSIPTAVIIHDLALPEIGRYSSAPWYLDWMRKFQYHNTLRKTRYAAGIITDSDNTKKDFLKYVSYPGKKVQTIYPGLSEKFEKVTPREDVLLKYLPLDVVQTGYLIYYGGIEVNKNVAGIVKAYSELVKSREESKRSANRGESIADLPYLVLAGGDFTRLDMRNPVLSEIRYLIDDLNLEEHVYFTGYFEDEDLSDLLCGSKMFVHLSLYEGFGFAPLEAMRCGVPVVASDRSCYPEVMGSAAVLVDPEDSVAVAKAVERVLSDEKLQKEYSQKGLEKAYQYSWDRHASETYDFLKSMIGKK